MLIKLEGEPKGVRLDATVLVATGAEQLRDIIEHLDVVRDTRSVVLRNHSNIAQGFAFDYLLRIVVRELRSRPVKRH